MKNFNTPEGYTPFQYLKKLGIDGLATKHLQDKAEYMERLNHELDTIDDVDAVNTMLVLWDLGQYARAQNIILGPANYSLSGSLLGYALGVNTIDPIESHMIFETFLSPYNGGRKKIHIGTSSTGVVSLKSYLAEAYGEDWQQQYYMEIMGLPTLEMIESMMNYIQEVKGENIALDTMNYNDPQVIAHLLEGKVEGIFGQNDDRINGLKDMLKPSTFEDLQGMMLLGAWNKPLILGQYMLGYLWKERPLATNAVIGEITACTNHAIIYKEQVVEIISRLAGCTLARSEKLILEFIEEDFMHWDKLDLFYNGDEYQGIPGCIESGLSEDESEEIYYELVKVYEDCENKYMACTYTRVAYIIAYLRYYYPQEFTEVRKKFNF